MRACRVACDAPTAVAVTNTRHQSFAWRVMVAAPLVHAPASVAAPMVPAVKSTSTLTPSEFQPHFRLALVLPAAFRKHEQVTTEPAVKVADVSRA